MPVRYRRLVFEVEAARRDLLIAALWERGTLGVEELDRPGGAGSLVAYFLGGTETGKVDWGRYGARLRASEDFEELDWMAACRERAQPLPVGSRLMVDPGEPVPGSKRADRKIGASDRHLLLLPARTAFGTGEHPSTALVVELMERMDLEGLSVLDVGAGSGILSFAACLFGATRVVGIEIDLGAALVAGQNRRLNGIFPGLVAGRVEALDAAGAFDLALVNVLPERIARDLGALRRLLRDGGAAIFSGILRGAAGEASASLERAGFEAREQHSSGEWTALRVAVVAR